MPGDVIPFPVLSPTPASGGDQVVSDDEIVACEECGREAQGLFNGSLILCNVCGHGGSWCELCDANPAVGLSPTPSIPDGTCEEWALCARCWH